MEHSANISGLAAVIKHVAGDPEYHVFHPARVVGQNPDMTLELVPDTERLAPMSKVPIRFGVPGVTCKVEVGSRVLLGFAGGDPSKPIATIWEGSVVQEFTQTTTGEHKIESASVKLGASGSLPTARQGDMVAVGSPTMTVTFLAFPVPTVPPGAPLLEGQKYTMLFQDIVAGQLVPSPGMLFGQVISGNAAVKA